MAVSHKMFVALMYQFKPHLDHCKRAAQNAFYGPNIVGELDQSQRKILQELIERNARLTRETRDLANDIAQLMSTCTVHKRRRESRLVELRTVRVRRLEIKSHV